MEKTDSEWVAEDSLTDLVKQLSSDFPADRIRAREALVERGEDAAVAVTPLSRSADRRLRWECAKTLCEIADPVSVEPLIELLEDQDEGVRWDAALGLIAIGPPAVKALLQAIIRRSKEHAILPGARHVLHHWCRTDWGKALEPVSEALGSSHPSESAPVAANWALEKWSLLR